MKIEVKNVAKKFGKKSVLRSVSFETERGRCIGILGENGSGKSTLFAVLTGLQKGEGEFLCDGVDLIKDTEKRAELVGFVPQNSPLIGELTAKDNLKLWYDKSEMTESLNNGVLKTLQIESFLNVPVSKMSGGMKKRLSIGCAVAHNPKILFLDEPSSALDIVCKENIINYLNEFKANGGIVIIATHDIYELVMCDELYVLKNGSLIQYTADRGIHSLVGCLKDE
jgi:ABC-2 type transport system ATP-binding protein